MKVVIFEKLKFYMHGHAHMDIIIYGVSKQKMKTAYFLNLYSGILSRHFPPRAKQRAFSNAPICLASTLPLIVAFNYAMLGWHTTLSMT